MAADPKQILPTKIVVIDSDAAMANLTEKHVKAMGADLVDVFIDADLGYKSIRSGSYDAALIDWKLKGQTSGLALLSRLRRLQEFVYFPVIISAGVLKREDLRIIQDFQCTFVMEKPLRQKTITEKFQALKKESDWYQANEKNIANAFNATSMDPAIVRLEIDKILASAPNSAPLAMIAANHLKNQNFLDHAHDLYEQTLKKDPNFLPALNGKAKLYTKMGRYKEAMETLKAAQKLSPQNIERLSLMGEIEISLKNPEAAIDNFKKALHVDQKDTKAKVGLAVAKGMTKAMELQTHAADEDMSVAKTINNLGVILARQGQYEKAIKYYLMSFAFMGTKDLQARVSFNMGLGFKKWNKMPQAKFWLEKSVALSNGSLEKAANHLAGLEAIEGVAGLGGVARKKQTQPQFDPASKEAEPASPHPNPTPAPVAAPTPAPVAPDEDLSFLEEETVSNLSTAKQPIAGTASKTFDSMVEEIDNLTESSEDFAFDEKI
jgi:tetratricopeptide (TPR) repeat protein